MVAVPSTMLPLGTVAPDFTLPDTISGTSTSFAALRAGKKATLVMFICNHCPFVKHIRAELARLARDYQSKGVAVVAICPNDAERYPDDAPAKMKAEASEFGYTFPYCHDESQAVSKSYRAACTPDFFLFDSSARLVYRGQLDDSRPKTGVPVTGKDLRDALNAVLAGKAPAERQMPSIGCNIKWKPGNEPDYFQA